MLISSGIIEAGADAVGDMPSTIFVSIASLTCLLTTFAFWVYVLFSFLSLNISGKRSDSFLYEIDLQNQWILYLIIFDVIYWFWFVDCFFRFMLSSMFSNW